MEESERYFMDDNVPFELVVEQALELLNQAVGSIMEQTKLPPSLMLLIMDNYISNSKAQVYSSIIKENSLVKKPNEESIDLTPEVTRTPENKD